MTSYQSSWTGRLYWLSFLSLLTILYSVRLHLFHFIKYVVSLPPVLRMRDTGKKVFILTNSDYPYTKDIMTYLMDTPSANGRHWVSFFDYVIVDGRKPGFFSENAVARRVDTDTGKLEIGKHMGPFR